MSFKCRGFKYGGFRIFEKFFKNISRGSLCGGLAKVIAYFSGGSDRKVNAKTFGGWGRLCACLLVLITIFIAFVLRANYLLIRLLRVPLLMIRNNASLVIAEES